MTSLQRGARVRRWRRRWCLRPRRRAPRWPRRPGSRVWRRGVMRGKTVGAATLTSLRQDGSRPEWPIPKRIIYYTDCFGREWATTTLAATAVQRTATAFDHAILHGHSQLCIGIREGYALLSAMPDVSPGLGEGRRPRSGAGGHVGGQDVVRMAVEVLARPVVAHRGPRIRMPGSDLDISQVHARIEHGRDVGVAEHVRVRPGDPHASNFGQVPQAAGGGMAVHPRAAAVEQDRPAG